MISVVHVYHICINVVWFQEPVVFSGSISDNLDPYGQYSDEDIWDSLNHAHLKQFVVETQRGLDFECGEDGGNMRYVGVKCVSDIYYIWDYGVGLLPVT